MRQTGPVTGLVEGDGRLADVAVEAARRGNAVRPEAADLAGALAEGGRARLLYLHGPGGIGKSVLAAQVVRLLLEGDPIDADAVAARLVRIDGRELAPTPDALRERLSGLGPRAVVVLDTYELLDSLGPALREELLPALPADVRVVLASRTPPEPAWFADPWGAVLVVHRVGPLDAATAEEVLRRRGVEDPDLRADLLAWADGLPVALALGAAAGIANPGGFDVADLDRALLDVLTAGELRGADHDVLAVAAVAPFVDRRLLAAVLPAVDALAAEEWLRGLTFTEQVGRSLALHARIAELVTSALRATEPEYDRELRLRVVDHLAERALSTEPHLIADMHDLAGGSAGAFVREALRRFRLDDVRPGDVEAVRAHFSQPGDAPYADRFERWLREAPHHVIVVRDRDRLAALALWATPAARPQLAEPDPVVEQWARYAARHDPHGGVVLLTDVILFTPPEHWFELLAIGNTAMLVRAGLTRLRVAYIAHDARAAGDLAGGPAGQVAAFGGVRVADLDVEHHGMAVHGYRIDYGPEGVVGAARDLARAALSEREIAVPELATVERVRRALRVHHRPDLLADAGLVAVDGTVAERAAATRAHLRDAVARAFDAELPGDRLLRDVIELGYLDPDVGHHRAMRQLHLSRATYFRRLGEAVDRLGDALAHRTD